MCVPHALLTGSPSLRLLLGGVVLEARSIGDGHGEKALFAVYTTGVSVSSCVLARVDGREHRRRLAAARRTRARGAAFGSLHFLGRRALVLARGWTRHHLHVYIVSLWGIVCSD